MLTIISERPDNSFMEIVLSKMLEKEMRGRGLTLGTLSKATKIPKSTLSDWINGRLPSSRNIHYLSILSQFFGISLNELLFENSKHPTSNEILFSSSFRDGKTEYKIVIEKIQNQSGTNIRVKGIDGAVESMKK